MRSGHWGGSHPFDEFAHSHVHDYKPHAPQTAGHQVKTEQTGDQEIYVARARFGNQLLAYPRHVGAALRSLQGIVHERPCNPAFRTGWIEKIRPRLSWNDYERDFAGAEGVP